MIISWSQDGIKPDTCKFSPKHLLRLHSFNNDPDDKLTEIWQAAFEPKSTGNRLILKTFASSTYLFAEQCNLYHPTVLLLIADILIYFLQHQVDLYVPFVVEIL